MYFSDLDKKCVSLGLIRPCFRMDSGDCGDTGEIEDEVLILPALTSIDRAGGDLVVVPVTG